RGPRHAASARCPHRPRPDGVEPVPDGVRPPTHRPHEKPRVGVDGRAHEPRREMAEEREPEQEYRCPEVEGEGPYSPARAVRMRGAIAGPSGASCSPPHGASSYP